MTIFIMINDSKLIKGLKQKDENSFDLIYEKYYRLVYYVIFQYLKNKEDTEEILNDTFIKMYNSINQLKDIDKFKPWLLSIAKNLSLNLIKKEKRNDCIIDDELIDKQFSIDNSNNDNIEVIKFIQKHLSLEESKIVILITIYDYKLKEVALELNENTKTIASKYYRAIEKLKPYWKEYYGE